MADDAHKSADMKEHAQTYDGMIGLLKWGAVASFILAFFVVWLIS